MCLVIPAKLVLDLIGERESSTRDFWIPAQGRNDPPRRARMGKWLDTLTLAEYNIDERNEAFTIDDLGNRDSVNVRDGNKKVEIVNYNRCLSRMAVR